MLGAIIGDIAGSRFEFHNRKTKGFELFHPDCRFTDDTVMTLAVAAALMDQEGELEDRFVRHMQRLGRAYPDAGYGGRFYIWLRESRPRPYNSFGNGSAIGDGLSTAVCHLVSSSATSAESSYAFPLSSQPRRTPLF